FQCMVGEFHNKIEKIILTASGGPFRGKKRGELEKVTREQALKHPNWNMGAKITIDSASLMNKGLEVIEAKWLLGLNPEQVDVVAQPKSLIHSLVQSSDGSVRAQLGLPHMRIPIQLAIGFPDPLDSDFPRFDFAAYPALTFEQPDTETIRNLALAYHAMERGGNMPCVLNAANEVAVDQFLQQKVGFLEMSDIVERCLSKMDYIKTPSYDDYVETDLKTRAVALELMKLA